MGVWGGTGGSVQWEDVTGRGGGGCSMHGLPAECSHPNENIIKTSEKRAIASEMTTTLESQVIKKRT